MEGFKSKDVRELQDEAVREGMDGISPALRHQPPLERARARRHHLHQPDRRAARHQDGFEQHTGINREQRERYLNLIAEARKEYDELAKNEVQRAFVYSFEEMARTICNNYLDNVEAFCNKEKHAATRSPRRRWSRTSS